MKRILSYIVAAALFCLATGVHAVADELIVEDSVDSQFELVFEVEVVEGLSPELEWLLEEDALAVNGPEATMAAEAIGLLDTPEPAQIPEVEATEAPEAEATEAPEIEATEAPEVEATEAAEAEATEVPEVEATEAPEAEATETPEAEATEAPEAEATEAPEAEATEAPEVEATEVPEVEATEAPEAEADEEVIPAVGESGEQGGESQVVPGGSPSIDIGVEAQTVAEAPTEPPAQTVAEAPDESPAQTVEEAPAEPPAQTVAEAPTESPAQTVAEAPAESPAQTPAEAPTESPTQTIGDVPTSIPAEETVAAPSSDTSTNELALGPVEAPVDTLAPIESPVLSAPSGSEVELEDMPVDGVDGEAAESDLRYEVSLDQLRWNITQTVSETEQLCWNPELCAYESAGKQVERAYAADETSKTVTVTNTGSVPLTYAVGYSGQETSPSLFELPDGGTGTLQPGQSRAITVVLNLDALSEALEAQDAVSNTGPSDGMGKLTVAIAAAL